MFESSFRFIYFDGNPNFYFKLHFVIVGGRHLISGSANILCIDCIPHGNQFFFSHVSNRWNTKSSWYTAAWTLLLKFFSFSAGLCLTRHGTSLASVADLKTDSSEWRYRNGNRTSQSKFLMQLTVISTSGSFRFLVDGSFLLTIVRRTFIWPSSSYAILSICAFLIGVH